MKILEYNLSPSVTASSRKIFNPKALYNNTLLPRVIAGTIFSDSVFIANKIIE